jgi:hypothetical protein
MAPLLATADERSAVVLARRVADQRIDERGE